MQKPIDLQVEDLRQDLVNIVNSNQQIPFSVLVMIVNELNENINKQYTQYKRKLREDYEQQLADEQQKEQEQSSNVDKD